jgi:hypothetical protein
MGCAFVNEALAHRISLAKKALAFFNMSFSVSNCLMRCFKCCISRCSGVNAWVFGRGLPARSAKYCWRQRFTAVSPAPDTSSGLFDGVVLVNHQFGDFQFEGGVNVLRGVMVILLVFCQKYKGLFWLSKIIRPLQFECIEVFYNRERLHSANRYVSPVDYELQQKAA